MNWPETLHNCVHLSFLPKYTHLTILKYDCFYLLELYRWNLETYITSHHSGLRWHNSPPKNSVDGLSDLWPKVVRLVAQGLVLRYYSIADLLLRRKVATGSSKRPHYYSFWTIAHSYWRHYRNWTTTYSPDLMTPKRCDPAPLCPLSLSLSILLSSLFSNVLSVDFHGILTLSQVPSLKTDVNPSRYFRRLYLLFHNLIIWKRKALDERNMNSEDFSLWSGLN